MDRVSVLPETILHEILARLSNKDAAKTIALSKAWRDTWSSFPNLSVCSKDFLTIHGIRLGSSLTFGKMDILIDYVTKRLLKLRDQGLAIKELKLNLKNLLDPTCCSHHVDQWIQMASESGVEVLELHLTSKDNRYDLPLCVFEAKSLAKLELAGGIRIDQEFLNHSMKFSSVKLLSLSYVLFTHEGIIEHLISHCPLIEHLTLNYCSVYNHLSTEDPLVQRTCSYRVKSLFLNGLQKLKEVDVQGIQEVHIDSPNLENLCYCPLVSYKPFKLNFDSCTNLRCLCLLYLQSTAISDKWFLELFSKYPFLESLKLDNCSMSERINILGAQLKVLKLSHYCSNLKEVNIDAPNLLSFDYIDQNKPVISFLRGSNQLEVSVWTVVNLRHFYSLREFIRNIPQNILASLSLFIDEPFRDCTYLHEFQVSSIPPSIKHLEFRVGFPNSEADQALLMNCLLWSCFPKTISFRYGSCYTFIEFFYEMLMGRKKGECHCSSGDRKCWWHALKIVNISCSFMTNENADFKAMLDASPKSFGLDTITFSLEL